MDDASSKHKIPNACAVRKMNWIDLRTRFLDLPEHPSWSGGAAKQSLPTRWMVDTGQEKYEVSVVWIADALKAGGKSAKDQKDIWKGASARGGD